MRIGFVLLFCTTACIVKGDPPKPEPSGEIEQDKHGVHCWGDCTPVKDSGTDSQLTDAGID